MTFRISKDFEFSAAHQLNGLSALHPCSRLHGHNYIVRIVIDSEVVDDVGFVIDYAKFDWFKRLLDTEYDHRNLNSIVMFNPTAENLARHFCSKVMKWLDETYSDRVFVINVGVSETPKTWAFYDNLFDTIPDDDNV